MTNWTGGLPGSGTSRPEDARRCSCMAVTDEEHRRDAAEGEVAGRLHACRKSAARRSTSGPTRPDSSPTAASSISATLKNRSGRGGQFPEPASRTGCTRCRSPTMASACTSPGRRPASTSSNSEAIAHHTDAELAAGTAGCNQRSTIVSAETASSTPAKLPALANDCLHMVVNNDPGLKAFLASNASAAGEGRALSRAADALAFRRLSAGQRDADRHAQRRVRARTGRRRCEATRRAGRRTCG